MNRRLLLAILIISLALFSFTWSAPKEVAWQGFIDQDFVNQVRKDLADVQAGERLRVHLTSPGGGVIESIQVTNLMRRARARGVIVEIHADSMVASGATMVLGAGTPGERYVSKMTLVLVHPPQIRRSFFEGPSCLDWDVVESETVRENQIMLRAVLDLMTQEYALATKRSPAELREWLRCGKEQGGMGDALVFLGLADKLED